MSQSALPFLLNNMAMEIIRKLPRDSDFLFPGRFGGRREGVTRMARRVRDKAGLVVNELFRA